MAKTNEYSGRPAFDPVKQVQGQVNGGLQFQYNIRGIQLAVVTPGVADTQFTVKHSLGYIPKGWLIFSKDQYCDVRLGGTAWTTSNAYLKCNATNVNLILFVF